MLINTSTNINMADREDVRAVEDRFGTAIRTIFVWGIIIFPWIVIPGFSQSLELPREIFLFGFSGIYFILYFLYSLKKGEFEWRRTKLNWIMGVWAILLGLLFLYSQNFKIAWQGYPGSMTGGLSEYLAFIVLYLVSTQLFSELAWKKVLQYFLFSLTAVLVFFIVLTVYFQNNNILTLDFARTPSLVTAAVGVAALAFWWVLKRNETIKKGHMLALVLVLFFVSSLLDFHLSWWMWVVGAGLIWVFDIIGRIGQYSREKSERLIGMPAENSGLVSVMLHGDNKYLLLIILFALSRCLSPLFLGEQKVLFMPFFNYLVQYPLFGQKVFFYLSLNLIIFCFGLYYFWKLKKNRASVLLVLSGLLCLSVGHLLYYSESVIYFFLNWILIVYAGLSFLRKAPERDFLYILKPRSQGKKMFVTLGTILSVIILGFIIFRVYSL
jgi:hypothetical protein